MGVVINGKNEYWNNDNNIKEWVYEFIFIVDDYVIIKMFNIILEKTDVTNLEVRF